MPRKKAQKTGGMSPENTMRRLSELLMALHTLAAGTANHGWGADYIMKRITELNPLNDEFESLYERLQAKGLVMLDGETTISTTISGAVRISGAPLWRKNLMFEYERDDAGEGIVSQFAAFLASPEMSDETPDVDPEPDPQYGQEPGDEE